MEEDLLLEAVLRESLEELKTKLDPLYKELYQQIRHLDYDKVLDTVNRINQIEEFNPNREYQNITFIRLLFGIKPEYITHQAITQYIDKWRAIFNLFVGYGANLDKTYEDDRTLLHIAVLNGIEPGVDFMIRQIEIPDNYGENAVMLAAKTLNDSIFIKLFKLLPRTDIYNKRGHNIVAIVAKSSPHLLYEIVKIKPDIDFMSVSINADTILHVIANVLIDSVYDEVAEFCDKNKLNYFDVKNVEGKTPLMLAAKYNNVHMVKDLLNRKVDVNKKDFNGLNALSHSNSLDVVKLLIDNGSEINDSALMTAFKNRNINLIKYYLLDLDLRPNELMLAMLPDEEQRDVVNAYNVKHAKTIKGWEIMNSNELRDLLVEYGYVRPNQRLTIEEMRDMVKDKLDEMISVTESRFNYNNKTNSLGIPLYYYKSEYVLEYEGYCYTVDEINKFTTIDPYTNKPFDNELINKFKQLYDIYDKLDDKQSIFNLLSKADREVMIKSKLNLPDPIYRTINLMIINRKLKVDVESIVSLKDNKDMVIFYLEEMGENVSKLKRLDGIDFLKLLVDLINSFDDEVLNNFITNILS